MKITDAKNVEGMILYNHGTKKHYLRVNTPEGFKDYDLWHEDLMIKIIDTDAFFFEEAGKNRIDTSPETLGLDVVKEAENVE